MSWAKADCRRKLSHAGLGSGSRMPWLPTASSGRAVTAPPPLFCHWVISAVIDGLRLGPLSHTCCKKKRERNSGKSCGHLSCSTVLPACASLGGRISGAITWRGRMATFLEPLMEAGRSRSWTCQSSRADVSCFTVGPQIDAPWVGALPLLPRDACVTNTSAAMMLLRACCPP